MNNKLTVRPLAFEYLRRLSAELSPSDYLKKLEQLELEFSTLVHASGKHDKKIGLCEFLSQFSSKYAATTS